MSLKPACFTHHVFKFKVFRQKNKITIKIKKKRKLLTQAIYFNTKDSNLKRN